MLRPSQPPFWYAIEAFIAVGDTTLDGSELIWRFLHFLPWQIIAFTTIGVATAALAAIRVPSAR
jgi:hypothetical protein